MSKPTFITLGEAARLTGKSKPTILKALNEGRISYVEKTEKGYKIDPAEVNRVYPLVNLNSPTNQVLDDGVKILQERLYAMEQRLRERDERIDELKKDRDAWHSQNIALLEDKRQREEIFSKQQQEYMDLHKKHAELEAVNRELAKERDNATASYGTAKNRLDATKGKLEQVQKHWLGKWIVR